MYMLLNRFFLFSNLTQPRLTLLWSLVLRKYLLCRLLDVLEWVLQAVAIFYKWIKFD